MPTTHPTVRVPLSLPMVANVQHPSVWLDSEAQDELGGLTFQGLVLVATPDALDFMAENVLDYLQDANLSGMKLNSFVAIHKRLSAHRR